MTDLSTYVFALDLTSVCVSTGIVQLPMKMQPFFEDGEIDATVDGEDVRLEFAGPRRLGGFRAHFEKRGLNANDRIRFELQCDDAKAVEVLAACVKRERSKPSAQPQLDSEGDGERFVSAPPVAESGGQAVSGERVGGSWSDTGSTVRAVRRVTIVGSDMLPALGSTQMNRVGTGYLKKGSSGRGVADPGSALPTTWRALDGLSRDDHDERAADVEFADTTVRAVRRRANHDVSALSGGELSATASEEEKRPAQGNVPEFDQVAQLDGPVEQSTPIRLSDLVAPSQRQRGLDQRGRPASARARIFAGRGPRAEQSTYSSETELGSAHSEPAARPSPAPEPIAELELVPVVRGPAAISRSAAGSPPATGDAAAVANSFVRSAATASRNFMTGENATGKPSSVVAPQSTSNLVHRAPPPEASPQAVSATTTSPNSASAVVIDDADFGGDYAAPRRNVVPSEDVQHEQLDLTGDLEPAESPSTANTTDIAVSQNDFGRDLSLVTRFLDSPEVPAIVRSDVVADQLGLSVERCERALERLSEDRDRVSRIRKGAYMIRRDATKRVAQ